MTPEQISDLKIQIDEIREYVKSDICKSCEDMYVRLKEYEELLNKIQDKKDV
jgi:hypothetical protein